jgi:hypothetical protein
MSALSTSHSAVLSALGSRSARLSQRWAINAILSHAHVRQPHLGGVPIVSYLVDECCDFIGEGGEEGGETYHSYSAQSTEEKSDSPSFFRL